MPTTALRRWATRARKISFPTSAAWLIVFVPALSYFLATRVGNDTTGLFGRAHLGRLVQDQVIVSNDYCGVANKHIHVASCSSPTNRVLLRYRLHAVLESSSMHVVDLVWRHDAELGRGAILLSDATKFGRVWKWEVGGGPIVIGKTLVLDQAGCRSKPHCAATNNTSAYENGSGSLAIDFAGKDTVHEGRLVVAEWGEQRIARLEENGARTPLVLEIPVPKTCPPTGTADAVHVASVPTRRVHKARSLLHSPFGDLLFIHNVNVELDAKSCPANQHSPAEEEGSAPVYSTRPVLYQLRSSVKISPLPNLRESRHAHDWTRVPHAGVTPEILHYHPDVIALGNAQLTPSWTSVYVPAQVARWPGNDTMETVILQLELGAATAADEEDDVYNVDGKSSEPSVRANTAQSTFDLSKAVIVKLTSVLPTAMHFHDQTHDPGHIAVAQSGVIYWTIGTLLLVLMPTIHDGWKCVARMELPLSATAMVLGGDRFLYIATGSALWRMHVRDEPLRVPTNLVA